ncbi:MAG: site-2 protease family protein [Nitrospirota bacterium]
MPPDPEEQYNFRPDRYEVILDSPNYRDVEINEKAKRKGYIVPLVLFIITVFSTLFAGAIQQGVNPIRNPVGILTGIPFSFTLLLILGTHEFSHYFFSKMHGVSVTLPYFIPSPFPPVGTFGAFIKMKSPILTKEALIDIGISGPIGGFIVSIIAVMVGLNLSTVVPVGVFEGVKLGSPLIFEWLSRITVGAPKEGYDILLHPVAFAGWIGLFVTSLNLFPIGQLDGGHIAYAILGERQRVISIIMIPVLLTLGLYGGWPGWYVWAVLASILGLRHPPILDPEIPLDKRHRLLGVTALAMFAITFIPIPFSFS